jgi:hypothetical protein
VDWIDKAQDKVQWRALVNMALNVRVPWNAGKVLSGCPINGSSRRAKLHKYLILLWACSKNVTPSRGQSYVAVPFDSVLHLFFMLVNSLCCWSDHYLQGIWTFLNCLVLCPTTSHFVCSQYSHQVHLLSLLFHLHCRIIHSCYSANFFLSLSLLVVVFGSTYQQMTCLSIIACIRYLGHLWGKTATTEPEMMCVVWPSWELGSNVKNGRQMLQFI